MATQLFAALMATNGWLVSPISWAIVGRIWIYNLIWLFLIDAVKVALYKWFNKRDKKNITWQGWLRRELSSFPGRHKL
jgi:H+-transporting ATPase